MGRKNRKKKEKPAYVAKTETETNTETNTESDTDLRIHISFTLCLLRNGNFNHDSELEELILHNLFDDGYFIKDEKQEVEDFIFIIGDVIFERMEDGFMIISRETAMEVMNTWEAKEGIMFSDLLGLECIDVMRDIDIIVTLLTTSALRKGLANVLVFTRFLRRCIIFDEKNEPTSQMICRCEQNQMKKYFNMQWNFKCRGVYVDIAPPKSKHLWDVPEQ